MRNTDYGSYKIMAEVSYKNPKLKYSPNPNHNHNPKPNPNSYDDVLF